MSAELWVIDREVLRPLPQSLHPLALIAAKETGADGYAIYQVDAGTQVHEMKFSWGVDIPDSGQPGFAVERFALRTGEEITGILAFVFQSKPVRPATRETLDRMARVIEEVWRLSQLPSLYARNAARIGELEADLADSKIADRACGMLASGAAPRDAVDTIVRHVESVLRPGQLSTVLPQLIEEIEQEIAERQLANRAKAVLQSRYGMSEDQAHVHLRLVSRKSRKRLRDVARDLLDAAAAGR
jgi:hypothetical protein